MNLLAPLVASVTVANPIQVALIAKARVKTDPRDALTLARLLAAGMLPSVWVPPAEVRELRALVAHRRRLVKQRTQARNRLRGCSSGTTWSPLLERYLALASEGGGPDWTCQRPRSCGCGTT